MLLYAALKEDAVEFAEIVMQKCGRNVEFAEEWEQDFVALVREDPQKLNFFGTYTSSRSPKPKIATDILGIFAEAFSQSVSNAPPFRSNRP